MQEKKGQNTIRHIENSTRTEVSLSLSVVISIVNGLNYMIQLYAVLKDSQRSKHTNWLKVKGKKYPMQTVTQRGRGGSIGQTQTKF